MGKDFWFSEENKMIYDMVQGLYVHKEELVQAVVEEFDVGLIDRFIY